MTTSGTASCQARPGRGLWLDQALAPEQTLPLALECSGALEVDLEQEKWTDSHTDLTLRALPKTGKMPLPIRALWPVNLPAPDHLLRKRSPHLPARPWWAPHAPAPSRGDGRGPRGVGQGSWPALRLASAGTRGSGEPDQNPAPGRARFPP